MKCAWTSFLSIIPQWMRSELDGIFAETLMELRLRLDRAPELVTKNGSFQLKRNVKPEDLKFCINTASQYSPWSAWTSQLGYITATGGHRIGLCGQASVHNCKMSGIRAPTSVCIRIARDFSGLVKDQRLLTGSILIIGKPGAGKTTLLRDLIRFRSEHNPGSICVVDEKEEIFPVENNLFIFSPGCRTDVISGCSKAQGINCLLKNMGPHTIAVDEITAEEDCNSLLHAGRCGVDLLATAHAASKKDLIKRTVYQPIIQSQIFDYVLILQDDKTWSMERMNL